MRQKFFNLILNTNGQSLYEFTTQTNKWINDNKFNNGIINISIQHTSASLIIQENADPDVQIDLINFFNLEMNTNGQNLYEFTNQTNKWIKDNEFNNGIINISIQHTSASLIIQENADTDVQIDLLNFFNKLVPMDNSLYTHTAEGRDDMPAHIKSALTNNQISLSVKNNELLLGTWQGLYLFEHRIEKQNRLIVLHYLGD